MGERGITTTNTLAFVAEALRCDQCTEDLERTTQSWNFSTSWAWLCSQFWGTVSQYGRGCVLICGADQENLLIWVVGPQKPKGEPFRYLGWPFWGGLFGVTFAAGHAVNSFWWILFVFNFVGPSGIRRRNPSMWYYPWCWGSGHWHSSATLH